MRFSIDLVFVDREGRAVKIVKDVPPWRIALSLGAHAVIEMAGGSLRRVDLVLGDRLYVLPASNSAGTRSPGRDWKTL
jgi:uncharacterized membrane protein (UPF0127 family)